MDKSDVSIAHMRSFVRVAERGSLSAVARELGVGQSTITRHLHELEETVGVPLLSRTTRRVTLTDEGSRYYANCVQILRLIEQAGDEARGTRGAAGGMIRISCTAAFGILHITRLVFAFQDRYPDIAVDLNLTDERIDLVREGVDIALRLAPLADSSMKLRALGHSHRLLVAAPSYLARHGTPRAPQDLVAPDGQHHEVPFVGRFRTNHGLAVREAVLAGRGIAAAHAWLVDDLITESRLTVILPEHRLPSVPLNMLIVPERAGIARVRLVIDHLAETIMRLPGIRPEP
jgi:DNA-binding transcriptional LysR family regulator